jgi:hypothetical protein
MSAQQAKQANQTAKTNDSTVLSTEISFDYDSGVPTKLTFDVKSGTKKLWLGVSLYPRTFADPLKEGEHIQIELNGERANKTVKVGPKFSGGSFEAAIWGKKILKADCAIPECYWCSKNGFHLDDMLLYKSGFLFLSR